MERLETERLILRPFELWDLNDFYQYARNPNVGPNAGWPPHRNKWETLQVLWRFMQEDGIWAIVLREEGKLIGSVSLHSDPKRTNHKVRMLGYVLDEPYWGYGYATEAARAVLRHAFLERRLEMVSAYHYDYNDASRRVLEKCGLRPEGTLRMGSIMANGKVVDHVCYSLTRREYCGSEY